MTDADELAWWREFANRIAPETRIEPGTPLYGHRIYLMAMVDDTERHMRPFGRRGMVLSRDDLDLVSIPAYLRRVTE